MHLGRGNYGLEYSHSRLVGWELLELLIIKQPSTNRKRQEDLILTNFNSGITHGNQG